MLFSGFGQTYFVGLFSGRWRAEFELGHAELGLLYSMATLASGMLVIEAGRWLDRVAVPRYTGAVVLAFAAGCVLVAIASEAWLLVPGIFLLRLSGQGLMSHIGITTVARHWTTGRGRALSIAQLGFPAGEALFPALLVAASTLLSWRANWIACAGVFLVVVLPVMLRLARRVPDVFEGTEHGAGDLDRRAVLRDLRFYLVLPIVLVPPFVVTGLFFHQGAVAEAMQWPLALLASAFVVYAVSQVAGGLLAGWVIDRIGTRRLLRFYLFPMALGCAVLWLGEHRALAFGYMALLGLSAGAGGTITGALWVELYGTRHIGAIRAMQHALMVTSTAASPVLFRWG